MEGFQSNETEWNQAIAYHERIHGSLLLCHRGRNSNDFKSWVNGIEGLYAELVAWMTKAEEGEWVKFESSLSRISNGANISGVSKHKSLLDAEIFLRRVMHRTGMDLPRKNDPRKSLG